MFALAAKSFLRSEDGAVTVDWVVLTAAIVGLGVGVVMQLADSTENLATVVGDAVGNSRVGNN